MKMNYGLETCHTSVCNILSPEYLPVWQYIPTWRYIELWLVEVNGEHYLYSCIFSLILIWSELMTGLRLYCGDQ